MRGKLPALILTLLVITFLSEQCVAMGIVSAIGLLSSAATLEQFIKVMYGHIFKGPQRETEARLIVKKINNDIKYLLEDIYKAVTEQPGINDYTENHDKLKDHIRNIGDVFKKAVQMQMEIENSSRERESRYIRFRNNFEPQIDKAIDEVEYMLLNGKSWILPKNFTEGLRLYENICKIGMSELQLLESLLKQFHIATSMYYITKNKMYDFVQHYRNNSQTLDTAKTHLRIRLMENYNHVVTEFKNTMATASRELRKCDGPKTNRYENKPEGPYYELMAFTQYIMNEELYYDEVTECSYVQCRNISNRMIDKCRSDHDNFGWCSKTRKCRSKLIYCNDLHEYRDQSSIICINSDINAHNRYTSFMPETLFPFFRCNNGTSKSVRDLTYHGKFDSRAGSLPFNYCKFCQCICPENIYYISTDNVRIPDGLNQMVITGARLVVEDNTIYIQIQLRKLMADGKIDANAAHEWEPIKKNGSREEISWGGVRSIDLTTTMLPYNKVITGMQFKLSPINKERVYLHLYSCKFNFRTSHMYRCKEQPYSKNPQKQLNLKDADVPTNSKRSNVPDSNEDQYVTFTTSGMEQDGGQTTIPFIDTQSITTTPLSPLGGAGMYHRGQPGYGGFLALRLYTYDLVKYINENTTIPNLKEL